MTLLQFLQRHDSSLIVITTIREMIDKICFYAAGHRSWVAVI